MEILILGGTRFVGRHLAAAVLRRGHRLTLFHRGRTGRELFPEAARILGDRRRELGGLEDRRWDAVIDTSGSEPSWVARAVGRLRPKVGRYLYVSTVMVYRDLRGAGLGEAAPTVDPLRPGEEGAGPTAYPASKVGGEVQVLRAFGTRALVVRPGVVVGPHDPSDRLVYWLRRAADPSGPMIAPEPARAPVQLLDARDLSDWAVRLLEEGAEGIFNAAAPSPPMRRCELLELAGRVAGGTPGVRWVEEERLAALGVRLWEDLPLCLPEQLSGALAVETASALAAGLEPRDLEQTLRDVRAWDLARGAPALGTGLSREREREVLARLDREPR